MIDHLSRQGRPSRTALYLRCYPSDTAGLECQRAALERLALQRGLPVPTSYVDDGMRSGTRLPALERLLGRAEHGWVDVVLVPGPFVFSLDDRAARAAVRRLESLGCTVLEPPPGRARPPAGPARRVRAAPGRPGGSGRPRAPPARATRAPPAAGRRPHRVTAPGTRPSHRPTPLPAAGTGYPGGRDRTPPRHDGPMASAPLLGERRSHGREGRP
ncbi:recombinase family protein [Kitasatospora aburaviensis]